MEKDASRKLSSKICAHHKAINYSTPTIIEKFIICLIFSFFPSLGVNPGSLHTVDAGCYPRPVVRSIAPPNIITHPRTITTYECSGFDEALDHIRQNYMCVAIETGVITKEVYRYSHNSLAKRNFTNHTKCKMMCVCELDGFQCEAEDKMKGDVPCPDGYM